MQLAATQQLLSLCCGLSILQAISDVVPANVINTYIPSVVKALNKCSREIAQSGQQHQQHYQAVAAALKLQQAG
jgi:hypothetical protein